MPAMHFWEDAKHDNLLSTKGRETQLGACFHSLDLCGSVIFLLFSDRLHCTWFRDSKQFRGLSCTSRMLYVEYQTF